MALRMQMYVCVYVRACVRARACTYLRMHLSRSHSFFKLDFSPRPRELSSVISFGGKSFVGNMRDWYFLLPHGRSSMSSQLTRAHIDQTFIHWLRNAISPLSYFRAIGNEDVWSDDEFERCSELVYFAVYNIYISYLKLGLPCGLYLLPLEFKVQFDL